MEAYMQSSLIGQDRLDKLYAGYVRGTFNTVIIKDTHIRNSTEGMPLWLLRKISLQQEMEHSNIIRVLDVVSEKNAAGELHMYQVFDCEGRVDLKVYMKNSLKEMPRDERFNTIKKILFDILQGISYYHFNKRVHGNLTSHHVLVNQEDGSVKLADFGMCPTPAYKAPEVVFSYPHCSFPIDIWSAGCMFAEMVNEKRKFPTVADVAELVRFYRGLYTLEGEEKWRWTNITTMLNMHDNEASARRNLADYCSGLDKEGVDLLERMLWMNPGNRITVWDAIEHSYFKELRNA